MSMEAKTQESPKEEQRAPTFEELPPQVDIEALGVGLMSEEPFFADFMVNMTKRMTRDIPTACVYAKPDGEIGMLINDMFMAKHSLQERLGIMVHEFYHVILMHITERLRKPGDLWNIATDLSINSLIVHSQGSKFALPDLCLLPGRRPKCDKDSPKEILTPLFEKLADRIASFQHMLSADFYFEELKKIVEDFQQANPDAGVDATLAGFGTLDDHGRWGEMSDEQKERIKEVIRDIVQNSVKKADSRSHGWGTVPDHIQREIRALIARTVDWETVFRAFVSGRQKAKPVNTHKKINRKQPYTYPGIKKSRGATIVCCVDQSGSVCDDLLEKFFGALNALSQRVTFWVLPFDADASWNEAFEWKRNQRKPSLKRIRDGGTDFSAPTEVCNKAPVQVDGIVFLTDGQAPKPCASRKRRLWILPPDDKLYFETDELCVNMQREH